MPATPLIGALLNLVDVSDLFYFYFFCSGDWPGGVQGDREGGGGRFFVENPRREGGVSQDGGGGRGGREGVCREFGAGG